MRGLVVLLSVILAGCQATGTSDGRFPEIRTERLLEDASQFVTDRAIANWIAQEAAVAGVTSIRAFRPGENNNRMLGQADTGTYQVAIDGNSEAGRSPANLTHEIAHVAAYRRGCYVHGNSWIEYWMDLAIRFEAEFPGQRWGAATPTQDVNASYSRYTAAELNRC